VLCASSGRRKIRLITRNRKAAPRFAAGLVRRVVRQVPPDGAGVSRGFPCELSGRWAAIGGRKREAARAGQLKRWAGNHLPVPGGTVATTCVRGDNNTACGSKDPRRIFYQQRTGRKGHGSNSSQSEGPINIAARHTDVRWIAMSGPHGTMKPTKPNSDRTRPEPDQNQTRTSTQSPSPRHTHPLLHLLPTPESLPKTCSRISKVAVTALIRTEHFPENCLQSCPAVKTSLRISTSGEPACHLSGLNKSA